MSQASVGANVTAERIRRHVSQPDEPCTKSCHEKKRRDKRHQTTPGVPRCQSAHPGRSPNPSPRECTSYVSSVNIRSITWLVGTGWIVTTVNVGACHSRRNIPMGKGALTTALGHRRQNKLTMKVARGSRGRRVCVALGHGSCDTWTLMGATQSTVGAPRNHATHAHRSEPTWDIQDATALLLAAGLNFVITE